MIYLQRLWQKIRYNSILRLLHDGLVRIGLNVTFFYLIEEGLHLQTIPFNKNEFADYSVDYLKEDDLNIICSIREKPYKKEILINRMKDDCSCLLIKKDNEVVGYTWFDLSKYTIGTFKFSLKENEAYLFDAYVLMKYRGNKIAPFIRYQCYNELKKLNKTVLYSISELFNKQSINFKKKLNAKIVSLVLYINLFNKVKFSRQIKKFI
jgi:hypothetical protein